jgi:hypothetical protein
LPDPRWPDRQRHPLLLGRDLDRVARQKVWLRQAWEQHPVWPDVGLDRLPAVIIGEVDIIDALRLERDLF